MDTFPNNRPILAASLSVQQEILKYGTEESGELFTSCGGIPRLLLVLRKYYKVMQLLELCAHNLRYVVSFCGKHKVRGICQELIAVPKNTRALLSGVDCLLRVIKEHPLERELQATCGATLLCLVALNPEMTKYIGGEKNVSNLANFMKVYLY